MIFEYSQNRIDDQVLMLYDSKGKVSKITSFYDSLWKTLVDRQMNKKDLIVLQRGWLNTHHNSHGQE